MSKSRTTVGILGCGPSGLVAANALRRMGHEVTVFSQPDLDTGKARPSFIAGAQYSHDAILGYDDPTRPETHIQVVKHGTREGYAEKVYGNPEAPVSWDNYDEGEYPAWSLRGTYDALWQRWQARIVPVSVTPRAAAVLPVHGILEGLRPDGTKVLAAADAWVSTIPLKRLCHGVGHEFLDQVVHIRQLDAGRQPNQIVYNGEDSPGWYRASHLFGFNAYEYSGKKPPLEDIVTIRKPLATNCDCYSTSEIPFMLTGRYGRWNKGILVNHVQDEALEFGAYLREKESA